MKYAKGIKWKADVPEGKSLIERAREAAAEKGTDEDRRWLKEAFMQGARHARIIPMPTGAGGFSVGLVDHKMQEWPT